MKHIGILGISSGGAALCYTTICEESWKVNKSFNQPEITLHNHSLKHYIKFIENDNWNSVADLMISSLRKLMSAGADFAICPDNTVHIAFDKAQRESPIPLISILDVVTDECIKKGYKKVGLLGTKYTMQSMIYKKPLEKLSIELVVPDADDQETINTFIFDELSPAKITKASGVPLLKFIDNFKAASCDAVILGCTELPFVLTEENSLLPLLDSTRLLAKRAFQYAMEK